MGSTNFTPNYNLPQFIGTDKPAWLTDVNGAFSSIDIAIKNTADAASNASSVAGSASSTAATAANKANTLNTQINTPSTGLAAVVSGHTTDISNIKSGIGTTVLPTTAQTITGAIDEIYNDMPSTSGLLTLVTAATITDAGDGVKTRAQQLNNIYTALASVFASLQADEYIKITTGTMSASAGDFPGADPTMLRSIPATVTCRGVRISGNEAYIVQLDFSSNSKVLQCSNSWTVQDASSEASSSGVDAYLKYEKYKIMA